MTIDEQIKIFESNSEFERKDGDLQGCLNFSQLSEWLKDYKRLLGAIDAIKAEIEKVGYAKDEYGDIRADVLSVGQVLNIIEKHTGGDGM